MRGIVPLLVALAWVGACTSSQKAPQNQASSAAADSVRMAAKAFDSTVFDTLTWTNRDSLLSRGALVFRISCAPCHGAEGRGNGGMVVGTDTLRPPSFLTADWKYANDPMGLREIIFTGTPGRMPHWSLVGLGIRDIDAVAHYITDSLRVEYKAGS